MASILAHELVEAQSDPIPGTGWTDANGEENAVSGDVNYYRCAAADFLTSCSFTLHDVGSMSALLRLHP